MTENNQPKISTLRPGLLVAMNTSIKGNITYRTHEIEPEHVDSDGVSHRAVWETTRITADPVEHDAALKVRTKARGLILTVAYNTAFGLLVPEDKADELGEAVTAARALAEDFNAGANLTRISVNVLAARIAQDDVAAAEAISAEVRDLIDGVKQGVIALDPEAIRDNANKLAVVGKMLSDDAQGRMQVALEAGRKAAREITKLVKAGETAALEVDRAALAQIDMARTSFLDIDVIDSAEVATPDFGGRAIDLSSHADDDDPSDVDPSDVDAGEV